MRRQPARLPSRQQGFTLVELVAAFAIFAISFGILMSILSDSLHSTRQSADYTRAALWAQSLLDPVGVGETLREGASSGRFDDKYRWRLNIAKVDPPEPIAALGAAVAATPGNAGAPQAVITQMGNAAIDLYQIELVVSWGSYMMAHNARFVTLRAVTPDGANGGALGGNNFVPYTAPANGRGKQQ